MVYEDVETKEKTIAKGIEGKVKRITSIGSCDVEYFSVGVLTENGEVFINKYVYFEIPTGEEWGVLTYPMDFIKLNYPEKVYGITVAAPIAALYEEGCPNLYFYIYDENGVLREVNFEYGSGKIVKATVGKTWEEINPFKEVIYDGLNHNLDLVVYKYDLGEIQFNWQFDNNKFILDESGNKVSAKEVFFVVDDNDFATIYIITKDNSILHIAYDMMEYTKATVAKKYNSKKVFSITTKELEDDNDEYFEKTITYEGGSRETFKTYSEVYIVTPPNE